MKLEEQVKTRIGEVLQDIRPEEAYKPGDEKKVLRKIKAKLDEATREMAPAKLLENVKLMWEMLRDPDYELEWETKAWIIFALVYFVAPIDLIPDATPGIGYLDDAMVIGYVAVRLKDDFDAYRKWKATRSLL